MAYNNTSNYGRNGGRDYTNQNRNYQDSHTETFEVVRIPLHVYYSDKAKELLPEGQAAKFADAFKQIPPHQLRKPLDQAKQAVAEMRQSDKNFVLARNRLIAIVPMAAYNAGRDKKKLMVLYNFIKSTINLESIQSPADIDAFDELMTAIVAYHKLFAKAK